MMIVHTMTVTIQIMEIKQLNPLKFRHEYKHRINKLDDYDLSGRLRKMFKQDSHADSRGIYRVSSLYFDTPNDKALREKIDGVKTREKFRLRYYNDNTDFIKLEKKSKTNNLSTKLSAVLTHQQAQMIIEGKIDFLLELKNPLCTEFYSKLKAEQLKPKTIVVYDREAFIYQPGNCRITFDRNLKTSLGVTEFLDPSHFKYDISEAITILEVKYDEFLPDIVKHAVQLNSRSSAAFSKYAVSRNHE